MNRGAVLASPVPHRVIALRPRFRSEDPGDTFPVPAGIGRGFAVRALRATHSLPGPPQSIDRDSSGTAPDRPTIDALFRALRPDCRGRGLPDQDGDRSAPPDSRTRSSTGTPGPAIPGSNLPASA